jgi:hypothetical protein
MKTTTHIPVSGADDGINFEAHYSVRAYKGIAFVLLGWAIDEDSLKDYDCTGILEPDKSRVVAVMVGDDRRREIDVEDLALLDEAAFCPSCGQIGCGCGR